MIGVNPEPYTMRQLAFMVQGATFIWSSVAKSLGKGGGPTKQVTPEVTMSRQLNKWDL